MKLIVKNVFRDKENHVTIYEPGTILEVNGKERADDLVKRGLCAKYDGKETPAAILGKPEQKPAKTTKTKVGKQDNAGADGAKSEEPAPDSPEDKGGEDTQEQ